MVSAKTYGGNAIFLVTRWAYILLAKSDQHGCTEIDVRVQADSERQRPTARMCWRPMYLDLVFAHENGSLTRYGLAQKAALGLERQSLFVGRVYECDDRSPKVIELLSSCCLISALQYHCSLSTVLCRVNHFCGGRG